MCLPMLSLCCAHIPCFCTGQLYDLASGVDILVELWNTKASILSHITPKVHCRSKGVELSLLLAVFCFWDSCFGRAQVELHMQKCWCEGSIVLPLAVWCSAIVPRYVQN